MMQRLLRRAFTAVGFESSNFASLTFFIFLHLLKSSLVFVQKYLSIMCNDSSNHFQSVYRTKAQVLSAGMLLLDGISLRLHSVFAFNLAY